jgi:F420-0:gamma-glutamyl ligase-like protein
MAKGRRYKYLLINDVSEKKRHAPLINSFLNLSNLGRYDLVKASDIRKKVFEHLRERISREGEYDLILLGDRGGTLLFTDPKLKEFGRRVARIPYSSQAGIADWQAVVAKEVGKLNEKPRILVLESDVGQHGHTEDKLAAARRAIVGARVAAEVHVVAGAAHEAAAERLGLEYMARKTPANPKRLSEILEKTEHMPVMPRRVEELVEKMGRILKRRGLYTGRLPH